MLQHHRVDIPCEGMLGIPMAVDDDQQRQFLVSVREVSSGSSDLAGLLREQKHTAKAHNKRIKAALLDGEGLRATIKDVTKARGQRPQNRGSVRTSIACRHTVCLGAWSSGMIRASGARGRGFDSRSSHVAPSHKPREQPGSRGTRAPPTQANEPGARECLEENEGAAVSEEEGAHADGP